MPFQRPILNFVITQLVSIPGKGRFYLLRRDVKGDCSEVDLLVGVDARHHEEEAGALGAARSQSTQAENDGPLVFLNHLGKK